MLTDCSVKTRDAPSIVARTETRKKHDSQITLGNESVSMRRYSEWRGSPEGRLLERFGLVILTLLLWGCGARQIKEYEPKVRDYELPVEIPQEQQARQEGSLWSESSEANYMFADQRAMRLGDILTVKIEEFANAKRDASTNLSREAELNAEITAFLGLFAKLQEVDPDLANELIDTQTSSKFDGQGSTGRSERLEATVPVVVKKMLPNGNIFVEGHRVVLVNNEEHHFYISGVARPQDIDEQNSISSTRLADAEIEFTGRGVITDQQRQGWFARYFGWLWPF